MRVTVYAAGTRGDVGPLVALAAALRAEGADVRVATHARFAELVAAHGLEHAVLPGDPASMFDHELWRDIRVSSLRPARHARLLHAGVASVLDQITFDDLHAAAEGADAIVFTMTTPGGRQVAVERELPSVCAALGPFHRTGAFAQPILFGDLRLGPLGNRLTYPLAERLLHQPFDEPLRPGARRAHGLPPVPLTGPGWPPFPVLHGFSEAVVPRPHDWAAHLHVTGYWFEDGEERLPDHVTAFLNAGPAPVYFGLGSMRPARPEALTAAIVDAVRRRGERLILSPGWGGLGTGVEGDDVLVADLPHGPLFPHVRAVVHHGGAGTTAAGLRAGRPTLVAPLGYDQFFWGRRVAAAGAGPAPIRMDRLDADVLAAALAYLAQPAVVATAEHIGARIRAEDGAGTAARLALEHLS